ncbi:MAG: Uma2 family endonuclease [Myxococcota bacterium]|nr:Uma2 family endonuclease [Myxococcota bacterium]
MSDPAISRVSYDEYLRLQGETDARLEYVDGTVRPLPDWIPDALGMAGGTPEHSQLATAFATLVRQALGTRPCVVYGSDLRLRLESARRTTYADVAVVCGSREVSREDRNALVNPTVLVEVLSESSERYDRGEKWRLYRQCLESLREYVLVSQREPLVEVFRRDESGGWSFREHGPGGRVVLASIGVEIDVDELFRDPLAAQKP